MSPRIEFLSTGRQAQALARCVYDTYGLTFHRNYLYDPDRTLALNRAGHLTSCLAMEGDEVVGHLAAIRSDYEFSDQQSAAWGKRVREMGLGMVRASCRHQGIQASLVEPLLQWCFENGITGTFSKCVTHHLTTQRIALCNGGSAVSILLGGVPSWVRYDDKSSPDGGRPISTMVFFRSFTPTGPETLYIPEQDQDIYRAIYANIRDYRDLRPATDPLTAPAHSLLRVFFDPGKQTGRIHVLQAGRDIQERVLERYRWLAAGRLQHITVLSPLNSPCTALAASAWKQAGMVLGGVMPCMAETDLAVYQGVYQANVEKHHIQAEDPLAIAIRDRAVEDWERSRAIPIPTPEDCGGFFPPSVCL